MSEDYAQLTVRELKGICTARGISARKKKKAEIIADLEAFDASEAKAPSGAAESQVQTFLRAKREFAGQQAEDFNRRFRR